MLSKKVIKQIRDHAINMDWNVAFGGKSKGNRHLFRVAKIARFLAKREGADISICEAGAWLHDIGLTVGNDNNPKRIRAIAEDFLDKLTISKNLQSRIADCVESHEGMVHPGSLEAEMVHDADALDKMGPLGIIRHTWKVTNLIDQDATPGEIFQIIRQHLTWRRSKLFTKTAQKLAGLLNKPLGRFFADEGVAIDVIGTIIKQAKAGIISEKIAKLLLNKNRNGFTLMLDKQIKCSLSKLSPL